MFHLSFQNKVTIHQFLSGYGNFASPQGFFVRFSFSPLFCVFPPFKKGNFEFIFWCWVTRIVMYFSAYLRFSAKYWGCLLTRPKKRRIDIPFFLSEGFKIRNPFPFLCKFWGALLLFIWNSHSCFFLIDIVGFVKIQNHFPILNVFKVTRYNISLRRAS